MTEHGLRRGLALLVAGAFFMEILDGTIIAPAAPHIAADFGVEPVDLNIAISGYMLTLAVLIPVSGWLADRFGVRRVFMAALVVFTLASGVCALAPNLAVLTAARVLQGVGGAMMVPVGRLVVLRSTPKTQLVTAVAYLTWPALAAPVVAPVLGGLLAEYASWRWIFVLNVPLGVVAIVASVRLVPDLRGEPGRLDLLGFALTALGVGSLVVGLEALGAARPEGLVVAVALAVAGAALTLTVVHLLRARRPLLDLRVLRVPTYRLTAAGGSLYRGIIVAIPFLLPLFFQLGFGWSASAAGAVLVALFVGNMGIKPATTPLMRRFGIRTVLLCALALGAGCLVGMAFFGPATPMPLLLGLLLISGISRSVGFTAYNSVAFADVEPVAMTSSNTLLSTLQELGAGLGVALGAVLVRAGELVQEGADGPFRFAFLALAVLLAVPFVEALLLPRTAGDVVTGRARV